MSGVATTRRTALVTGGAGGIGRAACERLARGGWNVLAVDRDAAKLSWADDAEHVHAHIADVSLEADNLAMVAAAEVRFGPGIAAVLLNAAIDTMGTIDALPFSDFQRLIGVNLFGPVLGIKAALPALRRAGGGAIVLTSSTMGIAGDTGNWAYSASKHALTGLVHSLSRELGHENIRINAIAPGLTRGTGMTAPIETSAPDTYTALARTSPLGRWAKPDEMASAMEFLASPASSYVNGIVMAVDGGAITGTGLLPPAAG